MRIISSFRPSLQLLHSDTDEVSRDNLSQVRPKSGIDLLVGFRNSLRIPTWRADNGTRKRSLHLWSECGAVKASTDVRPQVRRVL